MKAIAGIAAQNVIGVPIDHGARLRVDKLEELLNQSLVNKQAVYAVVAIIGSTEEGCVDRLSEVLALRNSKLVGCLSLSMLMRRGVDISLLCYQLSTNLETVRN